MAVHPLHHRKNVILSIAKNLPAKPLPAGQIVRLSTFCKDKSLGIGAR
jgi:hypothetical protein